LKENVLSSLIAFVRKYFINKFENTSCKKGLDFSHNFFNPIAVLLNGFPKSLWKLQRAFKKFSREWTIFSLSQIYRKLVKPIVSKRLSKKQISLQQEGSGT
jgi:hypothetical protein